MKILYLITSLTPGGAELNLKNIISSLNPKKNFEISVCVITKTFDIVDLIRPYVNKIYCLGVEKITEIFKAIYKLRKILINEKPDILHCLMYHSNIIGRFSSIGLDIKVISSVRTKLIHKRLINLIDTLSQFLVDIYMVNSVTLRAFLINYGITKKKIILIENGVNFHKFNPNFKDEKIKKQLNLPDLPIISMVANFKKQKDYPTMLKAISIAQKKKEFVFLIIGGNLKFEDQKKNIEKLINNYEIRNIYLLGFRKDIPSLLSITDIWVSSTLYEGQSNSLLEAMAMKKPVITTEIEENSEVVRHNKEAILVPIKSPAILAKNILLLLNNHNLCENLAENAYKRVKKKYNFNNTIKKIILLYRNLLKNR